MIDINLARHIYEEFYTIVIPASCDMTEHPLTSEGLTSAVTLNENLKSLYTTSLSPDMLVKLASLSEDSRNTIYTTLLDTVSYFMPTVPEITPMYPDFPKQVMEMDEAQYRIHQMFHYLSTYGIEALTGQPQLKGWLPTVESTKKTKTDINLLGASGFDVLFYVPDKEEQDLIYLPFLKKILGKKERLTKPEREIVEYCLKGLDDISVLSSETDPLTISFKENLFGYFSIVMDSLTGPERIQAWKVVCQHTGDIWKCVWNYLQNHGFHLRTSQKRAVVRLLESYPYADFSENLHVSHADREQILVCLMKIDFNTYSRSDNHKALVAVFRSRSLPSFEALIKRALEDDKDKALEMAARRPGMLLRWTRWFLKNGLSAESVKNALVAHIDELSVQTLVTLCNKFGVEDKEDDYHGICFRIFLELLKKKICYLKPIETLANKKVYLEEGSFDFSHSILEINDRSQEGGYIRSGLAFKIPENVRHIRFFTYWNDEERVDIDLHAYITNKDGKQLHVGWNSDYNIDDEVMMSGDITHSNAAEFIDVDMDSTQVSNVSCNIHSYTGQKFADIDEVLVGMMAVSELGLEKDVELYSPKNCFFSHELNTKETALDYGWIDVPNRLLYIQAKPTSSSASCPSTIPSERKFSLEDYLKMLLSSQGCSLVDQKEDAEIVLRLDKAENDKEISLIDQNYFLGCFEK